MDTLTLEKPAPIFRHDHDTPWKGILQSFLQPFMEFHYPTYAAQIDWSQGYESLDQHLAKLLPASSSGNGIVDKLFKVRLVEGHARWVFLHLEVVRQEVVHSSRKTTD